MNTPDFPSLTAQPKIWGPIRAGFNTAANHISLLMFPILLDIWIWFGLHVRVRAILESWLAQTSQMAYLSIAQIEQLDSLVKDVLADRLNIMSALRTFPVGVPSMMSERMPIETPFLPPPVLEVDNWILALVWLFSLLLLGIALGTVYYLAVAQAALQGELDWRNVLRKWPWTYGQVLLLTGVWVGIAMAVSVPFSCLTPIIAAGGLLQFGSFLYLGMLLWLFYPMLLSPLGIFVNQDRMSVSLMKGIHLTRMTLPATTLLFLLIFASWQGLGMVWNWPEENNWLMAISLGGHAFISTALLAGSFLYYHEADEWAQKFLKQVLLRQVP